MKWEYVAVYILTGRTAVPERALRRGAAVANFHIDYVPPDSAIRGKNLLWPFLALGPRWPWALVGPNNFLLLVGPLTTLGDAHIP